MRIYETTFIVNPQTDNVSIDQNVRAVADLITSNGGKIIKENHMGTRRLAYPIQGLSQGYYATFYFEAQPKVLPVLERHFKLEDPYVRHLLVRFDGDPKWLEAEEQGTEAPTVEQRRPVGGGRRPEGAKDGDKAESPTSEQSDKSTPPEEAAGSAEATEAEKPAEAAVEEAVDSPSELAEAAPETTKDEKNKDDLTSGGEL